MIVIVNIIHSATSYHSKTIRFLHVAFDSTGDSFLAGDHQGNVYVFNLNRNRFELVQRTLQACTALSFNLRRKAEYLVALADYSVKCFDTDTKEMVSWMRGHDSAISSISVHGSGRYAVTTSSDTAQLWDLDTFERKRKLNVRQSVGIQKVFFLPMSNTLLSCFKDGSIFAWESDTLACKYQLPALEEGATFDYKTFAVSRDGRVLVAGGKSNLLHLWCLNTKQLLRIVQMPTKVRVVRQLEFLPDSFDGGSSQVLGVLSQDGIMRFINIETYKVLFEIGSHDEGISTSSISPNGRYIASVMEDGSLNVYNVQSLTQEVNKPPPPLVKVVENLSKGKSSVDNSTTSNLTVKVSSAQTERPWKSKACKVQTRVLRPAVNSTLEDKENELPDGLNKNRLQALLKGFGEYPTKYRMFIWRSLLRLPENHTAFSSLIDKGTHPAYLHLHEEYPIKSRKLSRVLQRTLSALSHWSTIFGETRYLPLLAFPFVKLFQNNQLICFEVIATVIVNWCQHWFEYFPNPPINILSMVENVLTHHDKEVLKHFVNYGVTSQIYAWPLLETLFSEVLTREEWLKLFDNIFSNHPSFFVMAVAAYVICFRAPLLQCNQKEDFKYFFHHRNNLDINIMIKETYHLMNATPADIHPQRLLEDFVPLTKGQYPVFNKYPKFVVDYQNQERERIRQEEMEYLHERQITHEIQAETLRRKVEDEAWYQQQELLKGAEDQRRKIVLEEEQKLADQRQRLAGVKRELRVKELQLLDAARRRFLRYQQDQRKMELKRLDDEIERKMRLRHQESAAIAQDVEVRELELEAQRRFFEQQLAKDQETVTQEVKGVLDANRRKGDLEEQMFRYLLEADGAENLKVQKVLEESLVQADRMCGDTDWKINALQKQRSDDLNREEHFEELVKLSETNRAKEQELLNIMKEVDLKKWAEVAEKRAQVEAEESALIAFDARRKDLLEDGVQAVVESALNPNGSEVDGFERLRDLKIGTGQQMELHSGDAKPKAGNVCLNDVSAETSSHFSLDRGRGDLECKERELMQEVRELRQKLAVQAQGRYPPAPLSATKWTS
ncbi:TBC1 domain family member 31 isoform X2 [Ambystoma mexicanum]|uniref:TBC1 domain family member 31 isoform X2 n=1 Tax=Ambystoma mexicanum TaxID=8296 RepID=UPI0037E90E99